MGTRHLICVVINNEYKVAQYGQWGGSPEEVGTNILCFLTYRMNRTKFINKLNKLSYVNEEEYGQEDKSSELYPENDCNTSSKILEIIQNSRRTLRMENNINFARASLLCEWAYVIDFDKNTFEVFEGFNREELNENERFYFLQKAELFDDIYFPIRHRISFDLDNLPTQKEFLMNFPELSESEFDG